MPVHNLQPNVIETLYITRIKENRLNGYSWGANVQNYVLICKVARNVLTTDGS